MSTENEQGSRVQQQREAAAQVPPAKQPRATTAASQALHAARIAAEINSDINEDQGISVMRATQRGFVAGISGALGANPVGETGTISSVDLAIDVAESVEGAVDPQVLQERMERFPELREVELPTGAVARFPELAPTLVGPVEEPEEEGVLTR